MVIWPSFLYHNASCSSRSHGGVLDVHIIGVKVVGHVRVFSFRVVYLAASRGAFALHKKSQY